MSEQRKLDLEAIYKEHKGEELSEEALAKVSGGVNTDLGGKACAAFCLACSQVVSEWYNDEVIPTNTVLLMNTARIACPICGAKGQFQTVNEEQAKELGAPRKI